LLLSYMMLLGVRQAGDIEVIILFLQACMHCCRYAWFHCLAKSLLCTGCDGYIVRCQLFVRLFSGAGFLVGVLGQPGPEAVATTVTVLLVCVTLPHQAASPSNIISCWACCGCDVCLRGSSCAVACSAQSLELDGSSISRSSSGDPFKGTPEFDS
jgi:hypothetical protein